MANEYAAPAELGILDGEFYKYVSPTGFRKSPICAR